MIYSSYLHVIKDLDYIDELMNSSQREWRAPMGFMAVPEVEISYRTLRKLQRIWEEHILVKYEATRKSDTQFGSFLKQYSLTFNEFRCVIALIGSHHSRLELGEPSKPLLSIFAENKVRFESSNLKKHKLVYKITDPMQPLKTDFVPSYKLQLALKGKRYTDEYQQLDMALEEESKQNSPDQLDSLYYMVEPKSDFDDLVCTEKLKDSLKSALAREVNKDRIFKNWNFGRIIEYGRGTTLNFRGPPGTGKTLAAHCLTKELGKKLLIVRYDQLQDCYVGNTEKHIQMVFKMAKLKDAVLFFDEADAIALSRESLEKSWEMSQVNTLLKELERFEGVCIFATNFSEKYDSAFERRLTMHIDFEMPTEKQALLILENLFPKRSREKNLDLSGLEISNLSGGDLKNVALNAAGFAVKEDSEKIGRKHIEEAIRTVRAGKRLDTKEDNLAYIS